MIEILNEVIGRVASERDQIQAMLSRIAGFIAKGRLVELPEAERALLVKQMASLEVCCRVLDERLELLRRRSEEEQQG